MAATFTPNATFDSNEKSWAAELGSLSWQDNIVFTKASLVEFLRTKEITVGPNFTELAQLPKYAQIGKMVSLAGAAPAVAAAPAPEAVPADATAAAQAKPADSVIPGDDSFRPTRRVRELPGGGSSAIYSLFGGDETAAPTAAPAPAPAPSVQQQQPAVSQTVAQAAAVDDAPNNLPSATAGKGNKERDAKSWSHTEFDDPIAKFRPSRRVREAGGTGGASSITFG